MTKNIQARSKGERILFGVCFVLFSLYALTLIFPFAWCFISSFKKSIVSNLWGLPKVWRWQNWSEALSITVKTVSVQQHGFRRGRHGFVYRVVFVDGVYDLEIQI